jgi:Zn-dependent protease with chaperone function
VDGERWEELVRRLEPQARANPSAHKRKVVLLALLGFAFILGFVALLGAIAVGVVLIAMHSALVLLKLLIPIGILLWLVARSLYVNFEPPTGVRITKREAPELFRMLDDVKRAIRGPRLHRVLVDERPNAGVVQVPRAGGVLGSRNFLVLGLPYLLGLTAAEFRAVMGHELGHLSRRHGRFGAFVYRVRQTWAQLLDAFEARRSIWTGLIRRFFAWYAPYFEAYTLPVARAHEFEADAAAAEVAGREVAASGLVSAILAGRWVEEVYWPSVYRRADHQASPPATAFAPLAERIAEAPAHRNVDAAFRMLMEDEPEVTDTHPTLKERLEHLGVQPETALAAATSPARDSAADAYLGDRKNAVVEAVDRHWTALIEQQWQQAHAEALTAKQRLAQLNGATQRTPDDELERAELTERFEGDDVALDLYRALLEGALDAPARFSIGRILLVRGDDAGLRWLDEAMDRDEEAVVPACELAIGYLKEQGRDAEAAGYFERGNQGVAVLEAAAEERAGVSLDDRLEAPDLPDELLESLRQKLRWRDEIQEAYLVRKRVEKLAATHPFYVLAFVPKGGFRALWKEAKDEESEQETVEEWLVRMVESEVPGELMVARIDKESPIGKRLTSVDDALLFARN